MKMVAFVPDKFNTADRLIDCISYSLIYDTVPVIQIEDTSLLSYYKGTNIGTHYLVVTCVDTLAECITVYDPNNNSSYFGRHTIDYDEFDNLLIKSGVIWMSAFVNENRLQGLAKVMAEYPNGSHFTYNSMACVSHPNKNHCSNCINYDNSTQCAAFARYVFDNTRSLNYLLDFEDRMTSFGSRTGEALTTDRGFTGEEIKSYTAKQYLQGLSTGAYVRVFAGSTGHAISVLETSDDGLTIYHANSKSNDLCGVLCETHGQNLLLAIREYIFTLINNIFCYT